MREREREGGIKNIAAAARVCTERYRKFEAVHACCIRVYTRVEQNHTHTHTCRRTVHTSCSPG